MTAIGGSGNIANEAFFATPVEVIEAGYYLAFFASAIGEGVGSATLATPLELTRDTIVRKYDLDGSMMWEQTYATGSFLGPNLALQGFDASVTTDRFGYIYVTAIPEDVNGTDWWARKLNP